MANVSEQVFADLCQQIEDDINNFRAAGGPSPAFKKMSSHGFEARRLGQSARTLEVWLDESADEIRFSTDEGRATGILRVGPSGNLKNGDQIVEIADASKLLLATVGNISPGCKSG